MIKTINAHQRRILIILTLINFFNFLDRQVIFPLFSLIKKEFLLSDFQLGLLGTAFLLVHSVATVPLGALADRYSRKAIISIGVLFWSVATFFSGLSRTFRQLLTARSFVGIGEASYAPAATAIITDNFPQRVRSQAQGIFSMGMFVGGTLGAMIGGIIGFYFGAWRLALFLVAIPGILLSFSSLTIKDERQEHTSKAPFSSLFKNPAYLWMIVSGIFVSFAAGGMVAWGVEFVSRFKGYNLRDATLILGSSLMVAGGLGVLVGSSIADILQRNMKWGRAFLISASLTIGAPFMWLGLQGNGGVLFLVYFFIAVAFTSFYHGPATVVLHDIVPKNLRATAYATYALIIHLVGETFAPALIGYISDVSNLRVGLDMAAIAVFLSGLTFWPVCKLIQSHRVAVHED